ncbi:MAG: UDP-N-acetylmuramate dehydrogenase [Actinomycetota bacterium]|nr:UDP-N-acetylmuramate dehydrogenase [Actinomycetota bacterium]
MMNELEVVLTDLGLNFANDRSLRSRTTYKVGGSATCIVRIESDNDLVLLSQIVPDLDHGLLVIGNGSNLLVADGQLSIVAVVLGEKYKQVEVNDTTIDAGALISLPILARQVAARGVTGLEWAVGVPGTLGGAVKMNAGGHGSQTADSLIEARVFDLISGEFTTRPTSQFEFGYRRSNLASSHVVVSAKLASSGQDDPEKIKARLSDIVTWRREHQPGGQNAGSVFVNPPGDSAGRLIEAAGAKSMRIGGAEVSPKHANFIQADPDAKASDVISLMASVRDLVLGKFGVRLFTEIKLVGFADTYGLPSGT